MKKLLVLISCILSSYALNAQNNESFYLYGVDFSHAKVYAADESIEQFARAFEGINMLLATESDKYNFSNVIGSPITIVLDPIMRLLSSCKYTDLKTYDKVIPTINYHKCVRDYILPQREGTGIILIAQLLNKPEDCATYSLVIFDIASRQIRFQVDVSGSAGGFGLRNYWARTIYNIVYFYRYNLRQR